MNAHDQQTYLEEQIKNLIDRFKKDRERHKRLAVLLKALTVSLAGIITILLGWKLASQSTSIVFANIALVLGAVITVLSAYEAFFDRWRRACKAGCACAGRMVTSKAAASQV